MEGWESIGGNGGVGGGTWRGGGGGCEGGFGARKRRRGPEELRGPAAARCISGGTGPRYSERLARDVRPPQFFSFGDKPKDPRAPKMVYSPSLDHIAVAAASGNVLTATGDGGDMRRTVLPR
ncbi:hypothetical protein TSOC_012819 [Tetrabaena socialis]|uniref:Uncharacterized protein n=1 Tax=Tetrabaena socialis TaxID=47790 RepID=A0A2J7ZM16_9CHLO|nr:hypothetical protein TSOC_012819 [Tetrabaena socialis]|eukprot:PNH01305.1 hypothetical protein TSOC_012819 [Tetrabaena socialis]